MPRHHRSYAVLAGVAVVASLGVVAAGPASAAATSVTLVGSLQDELGCSKDWQPDCAASTLDRVGDTPVFSGTFEVPAGTYEYKVALDGT